MSKTSAVNNIISGEAYKEVAVKVLADLYNSLNLSYGPYGSTTLISSHNGGVIEPTKDGDTILKAIKYKGPVERSIKEMIQAIVDNVIKAVGDGTTTSVLMSKILYDNIDGMLKDEGSSFNKYNVRPKDIVESLKRIASEVAKKINDESTKVTDLDEIKAVAQIALNNDLEQAQFIVDAYDKGGFDAQVNVEMGIGDETYLKYYDGYTVPYGYMDPTLINNARGECELPNTRVIMFNDLVAGYKWETFLYDLLVHLYKDRPDENFVIIAPEFSQYAHKVIKQFYNVTMKGRTTISVMQVYAGTNSSMERYADLQLSTGTNPIMIESDMPILNTGKVPNKHPETGEYIYEKLDENGEKIGEILSGIIEDEDKIDTYGNGNPVRRLSQVDVTSNIENYFGKLDNFIQNEKETKFVLNSNMDEKDKERYNSRIESIRHQIGRLEAADADQQGALIGLKNRLSILEGRLVTLFVGGITEEDKKEQYALFVDAALAVGSAIKNGYVYGASKAGLNAVTELLTHATKVKNPEYLDEVLRVDILTAMQDAYIKVHNQILVNANIEVAESQIKGILAPYNVVTKKFDENIISSTLTDIMILKSSVDIIGKILLSNQYMLETTEYAQYYE